MTPILTASVDAWPSRGPRVPTGAQELCPVIQQWIRASELGKMLGSMRGSPHGKGEQVQKWGWAREKVWDFIFFVGCHRIGNKMGEIWFSGSSASWDGTGSSPHSCRPCSPPPCCCFTLQGEGSWRAPRRVCCIQCLFQGQEGARPSSGIIWDERRDLGLGHQQRPRSR